MNAVAMAEFVAGSEEAFVERMNRKAEELGMQETHFVNACGLDVDGHETSAYDIALMSRELMTKFPEVQKYTTTWQDTIIHKTRKGESEFGLTNTNKLIKWYEGATGLKTGSTGKALYCLSGTAERNGLLVTGGSDFHGASRPDVEMGTGLSRWNDRQACRGRFLQAVAQTQHDLHMRA